MKGNHIGYKYILSDAILKRELEKGVTMIKLNLAPQYLERVQRVYGLLREQLPHGEIYLFGSYAKRTIKPSSDLDILVLLDEDLDKNTIRKLKWHIEEGIEDSIGFEYEVDLKIYSKSHFLLSKQTLGFESAIASYMIKLEDDLWK